MKQNTGPASKYERLLSLGEQRVTQIDMALHKGTPASEVTRMIQEEWGEFKDVKPGTLKKQLERYRAEYLDTNIVAAMKLEERNPARARKTIERMKSFDVMEELLKLAKIQRKRIKKVMLHESPMPILLNNIKYELKTYLDILGKYAELSLETGLIRRAPKQITGIVGLVSAEDTSGLLDFEAEIKGRDEVRLVLSEIITGWKSSIEGESVRVRE